jgi:hypothetical protein
MAIFQSSKMSRTALLTKRLQFGQDALVLGSALGRSEFTQQHIARIPKMVDRFDGLAVLLDELSADLSEARHRY